MTPDDDPPAQRPRRERPLAQRALAYLARREHTRAELARKLAPHAASEDELARLLDDLERQKLLSDQRFAEGVARTRGARFGAARVKAELRAHGVPPDLARATAAVLKGSELERARAVWAKRFGAPPADSAERLRQMRFLAARGFEADVIRRVVGGREED